MKKRLLFFFVGLVCSLVAMAQSKDYGFTSTISETTVSAPSILTTDDGVVVTIARGSQSTGSNKGSMFWGSTTALTFSGTAERTLYNNAALPQKYVDAVWTGAKISIPTGKKLSVSKIYFEAAGQDYKWHYKVSVVNGDGTVVNVPTDKGGNSPKATSALSVSEDLNADLTGDAYVKIQFYNQTLSNSKYFAIPVLKLTGELQTNTQTKYTKPSITQGAYDQASGTYAVTLSTQNDENGVINYTVGSGAKVSGAASGTTINVAPSTTITATVSGSAFDESAEATLTTAAAPKLAQPTYSIGAFNFASQQYTVTLAAAAGTTIKYAISGYAYNTYTESVKLVPGATIETYAEQTNMTQSDVLTFVVPAAPKDGESATEKGYAYSDGMTYNAGAFTIPSTNSYIGGSVNSGNSSISGCIKMRMSRECDPASPKGYGFHILVNPGYVLKNVKLQILNNYTGDKANTNLVAVYVDGVNKLEESVLLPKATANTVQPAVVELNDIYATSKVVFQFAKVAEGDDNPNQAQVLISADALVPVYNTNHTLGNFATVYYAKELVCPEGTKAYTGTLSGNTLSLSELADGIIPANTPAIIEGYGGLFTVGTSMAAAVTSDLKGTLEAIDASTIAGGTVCVLGYESEKVGFYRFDGATLAANKAYLVVPAAAAKSISIVKEGEAATGIQNVNAQAKNGVMYNLAGQRVNADAKGMVIVNGKVVIKK